ncbi:MAG: trypsin-like serine protease, partial [Myxococcales bacterium]|nr:trypsin-like serine protease [Myxococcales bacterium]
MVVSPAHVLAALLAVPMGPNALQGGGGPQKIHNGVEVPACGWPSTVALRIKGGGLVCTATLVHPQVVLTAAHCLVADASDFEVAFGEHSELPAGTIDVVKCEGHWQEDLAYCTLAGEVSGVPIIPPLMGCEADELKVGGEVVLVGYGNTEGIYDPELGEVVEYIGAGPKRQAVQIVEAINPPDDPGFVVLWGDGDESSGCFGDSGGPTFIRLSDGSWRVFAASGHLYVDEDTVLPDVPANICMYGTAVAYVTPMMDWFESASGFDVTPCHDAAGGWDPDERCQEFPEGTLPGGGSWANGCSSTPLSGPSALCGPPIDPGSTTTGPDPDPTTEPDPTNPDPTNPDPTTEPD